MSAGAAGGGGGGASNTSAAMTLANAVVAVQADTRALHQQLLAVQRHLAGLQNSVNSATNPAEAEANLNRLQGGFSAMIQGILMSLQGGISSVIGMLTGGALLAAVAMATQSIVGMAAGIETSVQSFEALTGSAETARDLIAEMNEFAAKTPYRVDEIQAAVKASMLYGFSTKEAMKQVQTLGDIASISGAQIDELTRLYAQMKSMGQYATVGSDFLGMMANRGIMSRKDIAKELGISEVALADRMSKGMLKWKQIEPIFQKLTMEGGRFYRGLERQSQTLTGLASTLRDNVTLIGNELGRVFLDGAKRIVTVGIEVASTIRNWAIALADFNQKSGGMVARLASALTISIALVAVVPRLITGIRLLASVMNLSLASTGWGALIVALGGVIYLVMSIGAAMRKASGENGTLVKIGEAFVKLWDKAKVAFAKFGEAFMQGVEPLFSMLERGITGLVSAIERNMDDITNIIEMAATIIATVTKAASEGWIAQLRTIVSLIIVIGDSIAGIFNSDVGTMFTRQLKANLMLLEWMAAISIVTANGISYMADQLSLFVLTLVDFNFSVISAIASMLHGITRMIMIFAKGVKSALKDAFNMNLEGAANKVNDMFAKMSGQAKSTADKVGKAFTEESDSVAEARKRANREDRDNRTIYEVLDDLRGEQKYGDTWGAGAKAIADAISGVGGAKDEPPGSGGGTLMRAGFVGLDQAATDMQQILLDEMKGDQQLGVLKDIRDVQKETLEMQKKGLAMGEGESKAPVLAP